MTVAAEIRFLPVGCISDRRQYYLFFIGMLVFLLGLLLTFSGGMQVRPKVSLKLFVFHAIL